MTITSNNSRLSIIQNTVLFVVCHGSEEAGSPRPVRLER